MPISRADAQADRQMLPSYGAVLRRRTHHASRARLRSSARADIQASDTHHLTDTQSIHDDRAQRRDSVQKVDGAPYPRPVGAPRVTDSDWPAPVTAEVGRPSRPTTGGRRSVWLVAVLPSGPAVGIGPPIAMPHVRTVRGGGEESGHQHAPNDDHHDREHSDHYEHAAYGTGDVLAGAPSTSAKASTTLWPHRSLGSTGRVGAGHVRAAGLRPPIDRPVPIRRGLQAGRLTNRRATAAPPARRVTTCPVTTPRRPRVSGPGWCADRVPALPTR
jgi:hypothetical protein